MNDWISAKEVLPTEEKCVLIWTADGPGVAKIKYGLSEKERSLMKQGVIPDPVVGKSRRSNLYFWEDEDGNNRVPYRWQSEDSSMNWFGQEVLYWMPIPELP